MNADQAEFRAMREGVVPIDEGVRDDATAGVLEDSDEGFGSAVEAFAARDRIVETAAGGSADEIDRRAALMGDSYPFEVEGARLVYRRSRNLVYEFCLAVSIQRDLSSKPFNKLPQEFERIARDVVKCFVGEGAEALRTGWPFDPSIGARKRFRSIVDRMRVLTDEWHWRPRGTRPIDPDHTHVKDLGIDFAVWKRAPDKRRGALFVLGQCACGDDWSSKFDDLSMAEIGNWFDPISVAPVLRAFVVPFHVGNTEHWDEANARGGLLFDRARLALIAQKSGIRSESEDVGSIERLIQSVAPAYST